MFKKKYPLRLLSAFLIFLSFLVFPGAAFSTTIIPEKPLPAIPYKEGHKYSVVFRGNGEAVVNLKVVLRNETDQDISEYKFEASEIEPRSIRAYQGVSSTVCEYEYYSSYLQSLRNTGNCDNYKTIGACNAAQARGEGCAWYACVNECLTTPLSVESVCSAQKVCSRDGNYDFYVDPYSSYGSIPNLRWAEAETKLGNGQLTVKLPTPVKPGYTGSFLIQFRSFDYAQRNIFGAYRYDFETLGVAGEIENITVGVTADADLKLRGVTGSVNFMAMGEGASLSEINMHRGVTADSYMGSHYSRIGRGDVVKSASNLAPYETFSVKGSYAESKLALYAQDVVVGIAVIIGLLVFVPFFFLWIGRLWSKLLGRKTDKTIAKSPLLSNFVITPTVSFAMSALIVAYTLFVISVPRLFDFGYGNTAGVFFLVLIIVSIGIYATLLFVPSLLMGIKRGLVWGIITFIATIVWLVIFLVVLFLIFGGFYPNRMY